jgi:hypothetical protein
MEWLGLGGHIIPFSSPPVVSSCTIIFSMKSKFTSSPLSLVESFSGKQDIALGRFDPGRRGLAGGPQMAARRNNFLSVAFSVEETNEGGQRNFVAYSSHSLLLIMKSIEHCCLLHPILGFPLAVILYRFMDTMGSSV